MNEDIKNLKIKGPANVGDALVHEIQRNRELLELYNQLPGGAGQFGAMMINADINEAVEALASGDVVRILRAYTRIKDNE